MFILQSCFNGLSFLLDLFFPPRCPVCDGILKKGEKVCRNCKKELNYIHEPRCYRCGKPVFSEEQEYCSDCAGRAVHYIRGYSLWLYEGAAKKSVTAFKYKGRQEYVAFYAEELLRVYGKWMESLCLDALIPVPVYKERKRLRGYNQAELLAKELGRRLNLPVESRVLVRNRPTKPQNGLSQRERQKNLEKAFDCYPEYSKRGRLKKVLLVDDIYTTGSTMEACAKSLSKAGVKEIYFVTLCTGKDNRR